LDQAAHRSKGHQQQVDPAARPEQGIKAGRHHHSRQDKRQGGQERAGFLARKGKAGKDIGRRQADQQRQQGGQAGLVNGKAQRPPIRPGKARSTRSTGFA
jgi:hypothetical protein